MSYMHEAYKYAAQSTCLKRQVGCVVVKNDRIIAYGFNHGYEETCQCSFETKNPHVLHAEEMALNGVDAEIYKDAELYVTYQPCIDCANLIISKKIKAVFFSTSNPCSKSIKFLNEHGVSTQVLK